jgi:hypothetical protein
VSRRRGRYVHPTGPEKGRVDQPFQSSIVSIARSFFELDVRCDAKRAYSLITLGPEQQYGMYRFTEL